MEEVVSENMVKKEADVKNVEEVKYANIIEEEAHVKNVILTVI